MGPFSEVAVPVKAPLGGFWRHDVILVTPEVGKDSLGKITPLGEDNSAGEDNSTEVLK
jgi:hypothetical protein